MAEVDGNALVWSADRLRTAAKAAGVALWSWNVDTGDIALDERARSLWDVSADQPVTMQTLSERIHPADLDRVQHAIEGTRTIDGPYEIDFRIQRGDAIRWISARGQGRDKGIVDHVLFAIFMDVTERKEAEQARELLAGEMSHRVKNLFAMASALTGIAERSTSTKEEMSRDLTRRLNALGAAHDLIRPVPGGARKDGAALDALMHTLLDPYDDGGAVGSRIRISGLQISVGEGGATTLALVMHELATNSLKYGSLSTPGGKLDLSCSQEADEVTVVWTERYGPPLTGAVRHDGFGSKLIGRSMSSQLGGSVGFEWLEEGLIATLRMNKVRLAI